MIRDEILAMKPGPKLDELVIEKVMRWEKVDEGRTSEPLYTWYHTKDGVRYDVTAKAWTFQPSTDLRAAFEVVEQMNQNENPMVLSNNDYRGHFNCGFYTDDVTIVEAEAPTAPEAICKAALLSLIVM